MTSGYRDGYVQRGAVRLHYIDWGGEGPPCVFVHPTGFVAEMWEPWAERLWGRFRCIATDRRGHGDSDKPESGYDWLSLADDLAAILDDLGVRHAVGIGHSAGATDIALAETRRPGSFAKVVLLDPIIFDNEVTIGEDGIPDNPMARGTLKRRAVWPSRQAVLESYSSRPPFDSWRRDFLEQYVQHGFRDLPDGTVELKCPPVLEARLYGQPQRFGIFDMLAELGPEVLLMAGKQSDAFPLETFERLARTIPRCTTVLYEDGSHFFPFEQPDRTLADIERFLA